MILYGLKACDTCRKALKSLSDVQFVDVREQGVPSDVLAAALARFGANLVNTRSTTWRQMTPQARELPASEQLETHPTLMKRPLIVQGDQMWLGWTSETQKALGVS